MLVAKNQLEKALDDVLNDVAFYSYPDSFNQLVLMSRKYYNIEDSKTKSIITYEQGDVMLNNLAVSFLSFLDSSYGDIVNIK